MLRFKKCVFRSLSLMLSVFFSGMLLVGNAASEPVIDFVSGTGPYPAGTRQAELVVSTDVNATCRINGADDVFDYMASTMQSSDNRQHRFSASLDGDYSHHYYVRCQDLSTQSSNSTGFPLTVQFGQSTVLIKPQNLLADIPLNQDGHFTLSWSVVSGAVSYQLMEKLNGGLWQVVSELPVLSSGVSSVTLNRPTSGRYQYQVSACSDSNKNHCSLFSREAIVSVGANPEDLAPVIQMISGSGPYPNGTRLVDIVVSTNINASCRVSSAESGEYVDWPTSLQTTDNRQHQYQETLNGDYDLNLYIRCQSIATQATNYQSFVFPIYFGHTDVLTPPQNLTADVPLNHDGQFSLSWDAVTGTSYYHLMEKFGSGLWKPVSVTAGALSVTFSRPVPGRYEYQMSACADYNKKNCSAFGYEAIVSVGANPDHLAPVIYPLSGSGPYPDGTRQIEVVVSTNINADCKIHSGDNGEYQHWPNKMQSSDNRHHHYQESLYGDYNLELYARCQSLSTQAVNHNSLAVPVYFGNVLILSQPQNLVADKPDNLDGSFTLSWNAVATATRYHLMEKHNAGLWRPVLLIPGTQSVTLSRPASGEYEYQLSACLDESDNSCGAFSTAAFVTVGSNTLLDTDNDGVNDAADQCPNTSMVEPVNAVGCAPSQLDSDNDGYSDAVDHCASTPAGESVNSVGCSQSQLDADNDGISNAIDQCAATPANEVANALGCSPSQLDTDADGVNDANDQCANTPVGEPVNASGCALSQLDDDADGVSNYLDQCPNTPAAEVVNVVGCGASQLDHDNDGVNDNIDQCPNTVPGTPVDAVGCDPTQKDSDGDGIIDVKDAFPQDPNEWSDLDADGVGDNSDPDIDGDGVANNLDIFPTDPAESADLDGDGIGDNSDPDIDGDSVLNDSDAFPRDPSRSVLPVVTIDTPATLTTVGSSPVVVTGQLDPSATALTLNGVNIPVTGAVYTGSVALKEGHNTIVARMVDAAGVVSTASISVSLDLTPPYLTVESHTDGQKVYEPSVTLTGLVNDIVRGTIEDTQANVQVNGIQAVISNRSYAAVDVPLVEGNNVIRVTGSDQVGNQSAQEINLVYERNTEGQVNIVSGQGQSGTINQALTQPLVVQVLDAAGQPVAEKPVVFRVSQGSGILAPGDVLQGQGYLAKTDVQGNATVTYQLGQRAGTANHKVSARVVGFKDDAIFYASASPNIGDKLSVNSGNNQRGGVHQPLPAPFVVAVTDNGSNTIAGARVQFEILEGGGRFLTPSTTPTQPANNQLITLVTDSDGRASAHYVLGGITGLDKQRVKATLLDGPAGQNITATFTASGFVTGEPGLTAITGTVLDNQDNPLPGVTISGVDNPLSAPIYMVKLNTESMVYAGLQDVELTLPKVPGFKLEVPAGSVTFPDGSKEGYLSVTVVNSSKVPMAPPNGMQPQFIVTIQPTGAKFDPPARLTLPNVDAHPAGAQVEMFSYDHDLEEFVAIGLGTVSKDSLTIQSNPGVGVVKAGWHCGAQPGGSGCCEGPGDCGPCEEASQNCEGCQPVKPGTRPLPANQQKANTCRIEYCGEQPKDGSDWTDDYKENYDTYCQKCSKGQLVADSDKKHWEQIPNDCKEKTCDPAGSSIYVDDLSKYYKEIECMKCEQGKMVKESDTCCGYVNFEEIARGLGRGYLAGIAICCNKEMVACLNPKNKDRKVVSHTLAKEAYSLCVSEHEDEHVSHGYCTDCKWSILSASDKYSTVEEKECAASKVGVACYNRYKSQCPENDELCLHDFNKLISYEIDYGNNGGGYACF